MENRPKSLRLQWNFATTPPPYIFNEKSGWVTSHFRFFFQDKRALGGTHARKTSEIEPLARLLLRYRSFFIARGGRGEKMNGQSKEKGGGLGNRLPVRGNHLILQNLKGDQVNFNVKQQNSSVPPPLINNDWPLRYKGRERPTSQAKVSTESEKNPSNSRSKIKHFSSPLSISSLESQVFRTIFAFPECLSYVVAVLLRDINI